jgi:hypothetical protein
VHGRNFVAPCLRVKRYGAILGMQMRSNWAGGSSHLVIPGHRGAVNPESRDSPMCNCTSEVRCFASPRNDACLKLESRHCEERSDEAIHSFFAWRHGLLRGACHRARVRATRWLAMTVPARRMGGAKRYPSISFMMGFAGLNPSYLLGPESDHVN